MRFFNGKGMPFYKTFYLNINRLFYSFLLSKLKVFFLLLGVVFITFQGCKKPTDDPISPNNDPESLSEADIMAFENMEEATDFTAMTVLSPDGRTLAKYMEETDSLFYNTWIRSDPFESLPPEQAKVLLINRLQAVALAITDRSRFQIPNEGNDQPSQNGLAYSYGSKDHSVRQKPIGDCKHEIKGLDCSGFIYQLFVQSGVSGFPSGSADNQRKPETLSSSTSAAIPKLVDTEFEDLGKLPVDKFKGGDIIYWMNSSLNKAKHIAIVLKDIKGNIAIVNSNGSSGGPDSECEKNLGLTRGPRKLKSTSSYWFGPNADYRIVRMKCNRTCPDGFTLWEENCHCYKAVLDPSLRWEEAQAECVRQDGHLATITSTEENQFVLDLFENNTSFWYVDGFNNALGPWIGGIQKSGSNEPEEGWGWITGEEFLFSDWSSHDPDNCCGVNQNRIQFIRDNNQDPTRWTDVENYASFVKGYIIEIK